MSDADEKQVLEVLQRFVNGWEQLDAEKILSTIAERDDTVIWGTDLVEYWVGYEAFAEAVYVQVAAFSNPVYAWSKGDPRVWVSGDAAWGCGDLEVSLDTEEEQWRATMRSTFVLQLEDADWRIVHAHFSIGQEEPVVDYGS